MKRIFNLLCVLFTITVIALGYIKITSEKFSNIVAYEKNILQGFYIDNMLEIEKSEFYSILEELSKKYQGNIFKTYFAVDTRENVTVEKGFIINNKDSQILEDISLKGADIRDLNFYDEGLVLSSREIEGEYTKIKTFGYKERFLVKPLKIIYKNHGIGGNYFIELKDTMNYDKFLLDLQGQLQEKFFVEISIDDLKAVKDTVEFSQESISSDFVIQGAGIIFLSLIVFIVVSSFRQFAILKSEGFGIYKAYLYLIGKNLYYNVMISIAVLVIFSIVIAFDIVFLKFTIGYLVIFYILTFCFTLFSVFIADKINTINLIKNRSLARAMFCGNILIKFIFLVVIIISSFDTTFGITFMYKNYKELKSWEIAGDYGIFTGNYNFNNNYTSESQDLFDFKKMNREVYPILNEIGSIYASVNDYIEIEGFTRVVPFKSIRVNPNYLKEFPVVDEEGEKILVSEDEEKMVVLIPRKYKNQEEIIKTYYARWSIESNSTIEEYSSETTEEDWDKLVKIIYIKDGQRVFSFNTEVSKEDSNMIEDPIIGVATMGNIYSGKTFVTVVNGGKVNDELKIKLIDNDSVKTYEYIKSEIIKYGYEETLQGIIRANELKGGDYEVLVSGLRIAIVGIIVGIILYTAFAIQNLLIVVKMDGKKFVIKRLAGFSVLKTYKTYIMINLMIVPLGYIAVYLFGISYIFEDKETLFWQIGLMGCYILIELILTRIFILINEKRVKLRILKGEE